jgi:hypothetical protein
MKKILICGDSFAADWTVKYPGEGWPNLLAKEYDITNLAQAGCSEYKIYLQIQSVNLADFDAIIVSHTSPYRLYVKEHPIHMNDILHSNSDLIYSDVKEHSKSNKELLPLANYFEEYFDIDHAKFVHSLICEKIEKIAATHNTLHLVNHKWDDLYKFQNVFSFNELFETNRGTINHFDENGNYIVYQKVSEWIKHLDI